MLPVLFHSLHRCSLNFAPLLPVSLLSKGSSLYVFSALFDLFFSACLHFFFSFFFFFFCFIFICENILFRRFERETNKKKERGGERGVFGFLTLFARSSVFLCTHPTVLFFFLILRFLASFSIFLLYKFSFSIFINICCCYLLHETADSIFVSPTSFFCILPFY